MKNQLLGLFFLFLIPINCLATTVIVMLVKDGIYIAADSKRRLVGMNSLNQYKYINQTICKIHNVGKTYFAIIGFDDGTLYHHTVSCLQNNKNLNIALNCLSIDMKKSYQEKIDFFIAHNINKYKEYLNGGIGEVVLCRYHNNKPEIYTLEFNEKKKANNAVVIDTQLTSFINKKYMDIFGFKREINALTMKQIDSLQPTNPVIYLTNLIKVEVKSHPDDVGEPIDILKLTNKGAIWLKKNKKITNY